MSSNETHKKFLGCWGMQMIYANLVNQPEKEYNPSNEIDKIKERLAKIERILFGGTHD